MEILNRFAPQLMNQRIALGFMVAMVLIASGFAISFYSYNQHGADTDRVSHTYEVTGALENVLSLMKDVETGARGYLITGDSTFLEPYQTAMGLLPGRFKPAAFAD